jgi:hypothetical protein
MSETIDLIAFNDWFSDDVAYSGIGTARFGSPPAIARGPTTVRFDMRGDATIEMEVQSFETDYIGHFGQREVFNPEGRRGNTFSVGFRQSNRCESFEVDTGDGLFVAHGRISYQAGFEVDDVKQISFSIQTGEFFRHGVGPALYWTVPLINFTFPFRQQHPEIFSHPLRMWRPAPTPPDLPPDKVEAFRLFAYLRACLIGFNFEGRAAFIEPLPKYEGIKSHLEEQRHRWEITSIMVGYIGENSNAIDAVRKWFPFYLYPVLELLAGREIGSSWIEWRDASGDLVGRTHIHIRCPLFEHGFAAFRTGSADYAGILLTEAQSSPHIREPWLAGVVRNLLRGAGADLFELHAAFVFLAIESMCERFGTSSTNLSASLDDDTRANVRMVLNQTANKLKALAAAHADTDQANVLRRIADRSSGMDQVDRAFGASVVDLMRRFGLEHDVIIASTYYEEHRPDTRPWHGALSHWRGIVLHGGYFDFESGQYDWDLILSTCYHLHDVARRIVLKLLGYTKEYQPAVSIGDNPQPLDWVGERTRPEQLGYERDYRRL